jgi:UDP-glucuronate decarboxylase
MGTGEARSLRVIVTGGAGFVGSHLCERLLADGHRVTVVDDLSTGRVENIAHLLDEPRFELVEHDVTRPLARSADRVYHLASPASPAAYQADPVRTILVNVLGTRNLLEVAAQHGARLLLASTSEVYGDPEVHPQHEEYRGSVSTLGPRSCYDEGKRCAEALLAAFKRSRRVDVRLARIFNTYGPRMSPTDGRVVSNFVVQALRGEDLTVYGDGSQTRSFCYVDDLVDGLVRLMEYPRHVGPVNLGNPAEFTVLELAREVLGQTRGPSRIVFRPLPEDDPRQRRPDIARARAVLGFSPRVPLRDGLARTIRNFQAELAAASIPPGAALAR